MIRAEHDTTQLFRHPTYKLVLKYMVYEFLAYLNLFNGPWWWSSGQRACLQLQRSEFESR